MAFVKSLKYKSGWDLGEYQKCKTGLFLGRQKKAPNEGGYSKISAGVILAKRVIASGFA